MREWLLGRRDDTRDALIAAALDEPQRALQAWSRLAITSLEDRDRIATRWLSLIALNIGNHLRDEQSRQILERATREAWAYNVRHLSAVRPVVSEMRQAGLDPVLLKGAALAVTVYPHAGARVVGDIDILVRPHQWLAACNLLVNLGWESPSSGDDPAAAHARNFVSRSGTALDLHRYLLPECAWDDADDTAWTRIQPVRSDLIDAGALGAADQLVHTCVHGIRWSPVHAAVWLADVAYLVRDAGQRLDWDAVVAEARRRGLSFQIRRCLQLAQELARVEVPPDTLETLGDDASFSEAIECWSKVRPVLGPAGLLTYWFGWRRRRQRTPVGFLDYVAGVAGTGSRQALGPWLLRQVRRRRAVGFRDPWGSGRSKRPVLPTAQETKTKQQD